MASAPVVSNRFQPRLVSELTRDAAAFIIASGLATLEVCANSYVTVLGSPAQAAFRLNFAQSFNGLASFIGPLMYVPNARPARVPSHG